ncbi:MAG TPA: class I SAM-dependent methyltransferase [Ktedonobacteraceae bacterium]|nr:class I SAM-dependent methyltransferase [Ktedonobacteraceae bacterium]
MLLELPASAPACPCEIANRDHPVELARLVTKTPVLLRALGGFLPGLASHEIQQVRRVLDIGCGPGVWSLQLARSYPAVEVIGIDTSLLMISYATRIAIGQEIQNVLYQEITSLSEPLPFENGTFDLINAPFLGTRLSTANWPHLLAECHRLLRPGGRLCLTEEGIGRSNASAHEQLIRLCVRAMQCAGYHFATLGRDRDAPDELKALLAAAGFREQSTLAQVIDYSYGTDLHEAWIQDRLIFMKEVQRFLLEMNVVTQEYFDRLYEQFRHELRLACFQAIQPFVTVRAIV